VRLIFKIQLVETIVFTDARVVKTTEAAASVASHVDYGPGTKRMLKEEALPETKISDLLLLLQHRFRSKSNARLTKILRVALSCSC